MMILKARAKRLRNYIAYLTTTTVFVVAILDYAYGSDAPKPVFVHSSCEGKTSATVLSSLREELVKSRKYVLVPAVDDNGRMDVVLEIYMHCTERKDVVAIASGYGKGRCVSLNKCGSIIDGSSIKSTVCDGRATAECGRILFNSFDEYVSHLPIQIPSN